MYERSHRMTMALLGGALGLTVATGALGQADQERAGARAAATEGMAAFNEGRFADAIDLFRRAETLVHAPTHLLVSARAHVKLGRLVQARELYIRITKETLAANAPQPFRAAQADATRDLAALEPRLARVTVKVQGEGKNLAVTADGERVPPVLFGVSQPFDPGKHEFKATAERMESKTTTVDVAEGGHQTVVLVLEAAPDAKGAPADARSGAAPEAQFPAGRAAAGGTLAPGATLPPGAPNAERPAAAEGGATPGNGMRIGAYSAIGVGIAGLAVGAISAVGAKSAFTKANDICNGPSGCPLSRQAELDELDSSGSRKKTLATIGLIVGGAGVSGGIALLLLSSGNRSPEKATRGVPPARVEPQIGLGWIGVRTSF